jgi:hypothetical protein
VAMPSAQRERSREVGRKPLDHPHLIATLPHLRDVILMKKTIHPCLAFFLSVAIAIGSSLSSAPAARAQNETGGIQQAMSPEEFKAAGLEKLTPAELAKLNAWLQGFREKAEKKAAMRESRTKLQLIVSRIDGVWNGIGPGEIIRLEDGTAWKLGNKDEHYGGHADHPAVAIYKSIFGWKMRVSRIAEFYVVPVN